MESTVTLSPVQQAAVDAAKHAGGFFVSDELLESKVWCEALVRNGWFFKEHVHEWIASRFSQRHPDAKIQRIQDIPASLYQELEQGCVDMEVSEIRSSHKVLFDYLADYYHPEPHHEVTSA